MTIRVIVADDQQMVRDGFVTFLAAQPDIEVVGDAGDSASAVELVEELEPDVVVMDIRMPKMDGVEATRVITGARQENGETAIHVLIITTFDIDEYVYESLRAGAAGFLLKEASAGELADAVRTVASGDAIIAPSITRRLIADFARLGGPRAPSVERIEALTVRETEVLTLIAHGLSNAEIAKQMFVAEETVKTHVGRIFMKLDLRDRAQAIVFAYETGLVQAERYEWP